MNIIMIAGLCIIVTIICKVLERENREIKAVMIVVAVSVIAYKIIDSLSDITAVIDNLFGQAGMDEDYLNIIFKGLGICYISQLACDCCRDNGENAMATQLEMAGKLALLMISLPLFNGIISIVEALLM